jgi:predicted lysophospholipase L1 biosynthesis ABC-type transport system permease subunit
VPLDIFLLVSAALFILGGGLHVFCAHEVLEFNRRWAKTSIALLKMLGLSERQMMRISRIWGYIFLAFGLVILFAGIAVMVSGRVVTRQPHLQGRNIVPVKKKMCVHWRSQAVISTMSGATHC